MGTHPIFESDFDCLTEKCSAGYQEFFRPCAHMRPGTLDVLTTSPSLCPISTKQPPFTEMFLALRFLEKTIYQNTGLPQFLLICQIRSLNYSIPLAKNLRLPIFLKRIKKVEFITFVSKSITFTKR